MRNTKYLFHLLILFICVKANAQNIPYKAYVSAAGPFGQPYLRYQHADNILYSADKRFGVTYTGATLSGVTTPELLFDGNYDNYNFQIATGATMVLTIDLSANGGGSIAYPGGKVYANFYSNNNPTTITGRIQKNDGTWYDITNWTNVSLSPGYYVWQGTTNGSFNYCKILEITITNNNASTISLAELEWVLDRPSYEPGLVIKSSVNTLWKDLNFKGGANSPLNAFIKPDGTAYFRNNIGINTTAPTTNLHVVGTSTITGKLTLGSLAIATGAAAGKVLTSDATGNATWQVAASGAGGWGLGGSTVAAEKTIGTVDNFDLPIITNNAERMRISKNGNVGIGITNIGADYKLYVNGNIRARKVRVDNATWPDYVFQPGYSLLSLTDLEKYIQQNKHLPEVPSAAEVHKEGVELSENQALLLKKVEELTLYIIEQNKKIDQQQQRIEALEKSVKK